MIQKPLPVTAMEIVARGENLLPNPMPAEKDERHFLFNCHRIAMDFGIQAAIRALELNTQSLKKTA